MYVRELSFTFIDVYKNNKLTSQKHKHTIFKFQHPPLANSSARLIEVGCGKHIVHIHWEEKKKEKENRTIKYTRRYAVSFANTSYRILSEHENEWHRKKKSKQEEHMQHLLHKTYN